MTICRYPGGKTKIKNRIIQELCKYKNVEYREPFFGAGAIGLDFIANNPSIKNVWINDKDVGMACLWTAVINYPEKLKEKVLSYKPSVQDFFLFKNYLLDIKHMPDSEGEIVLTAFRKLAIHQISYSGLGTKSGGPLGGVSQESDYKIDCRWSPEGLCKKIDKSHKILFNLSICSNFDFTDVIEDENTQSLIYLDPPYFHKGNELYQCGFSVSDHKRLAEALRRSRHNWVLSYDDCFEIRWMYQWANIYKFDVNYSINALKDPGTGSRIPTCKGELLITNVS